jgi:hypothetical protein
MNFILRRTEYLLLLVHGIGNITAATYYSRILICTRGCCVSFLRFFFGFRLLFSLPMLLLAVVLPASVDWAKGMSGSFFFV